MYHKKSMGTGKSARAFVLISEAKNLGVSQNPHQGYALLGTPVNSAALTLCSAVSGFHSPQVFERREGEGVRALAAPLHKAHARPYLLQLLSRLHSNLPRAHFRRRDCDGAE